MILDFVLQATGNHAWGVGEGWANAAIDLNIYGRTFKPSAQWGASDCLDNDGLLEYLNKPTSDAIFLLGFDWHSQMLHNSKKWQAAWSKASIVKIVYVQESIKNMCQILSSQAPLEAIKSASLIADIIIYTDLMDKELIESLGVPSIWQSFGVDEQIFYPVVPFSQRIRKPFFRGQLTPYGGKAYKQRRELLSQLINHQMIDLLDYVNCPISPTEIAANFNQYQISVNFPSVFSGHPTRVYEALSCGCALVTNKTGIERIDSQFANEIDVLYYTNQNELMQSIRHLQSDQDFAQKIAFQGRQKIISYYTLKAHLNSIINLLKLII